MFVTVGMCEQAVLAYVKVACLLFVLRTLIALIKKLERDVTRLKHEVEVRNKENERGEE